MLHFQMLILLQGLVPMHSPEEEEVEAEKPAEKEKEKEEAEQKEQLIPDVK